MTIRYRAAVVALAFLSVPVATASAQSGGAPSPGVKKLKTVSCSGTTSCQAPTTVERGKKLVLNGRHMSAVKRVVFAGGPGKRDDVAATVSTATTRSVVTTVPSKARTGPVALQTARRKQLGMLPRVTVRTTSTDVSLDPGTGPKFFYGSRRKPTYSFTVNEPSSVVVELLNEDTQAVAGTWTVAAQPGTPARVTWHGTSAGQVAPTGRYRFRVASGSATPTADAATAFFFGDGFFPIRGRHDLGQSATNNFGGGGQRRHMGQDMFASCGTPIAAARGGKVRYAGHQGAAGNYVVIDGAGAGSPDYVYMHMKETPLVATGERVYTGQKIGDVGETGRATGCQLHFELWSAPGWYVGGKAIDPLPSARAWDSYS